MNALQTFQFNDIPVSVIGQDGEGWMTGDDIGKALDYNHPRDSIQNIFERNREELEEHSVTIKLMATDGKQYDTRVYNEEGVMMIAFFSKQPKAAAFRKWAVKILKAYRNKELDQQNADADSKLKHDLLNARNALSAQEAYWFKKYPHWRMIRKDYYFGYPFSYIARSVAKSASACRRAVKRMEATGLINPRYAAFHRLPDGAYRLWLLENSRVGW